MIEALWQNLHYTVAVTVFLIGFYTMLTHSNLIKKIMGMNIMETAVFLLFISSGYARGARAPIIFGEDPGALWANPVPSALILTGIVIAVSTTAFALSLIVSLYGKYETLDAEKLSRARMMGR